MELNEQDQIAYDDNVKIHLMALQLLAEKNLLRFVTVDIGKRTYHNLTPERDSRLNFYWRNKTNVSVLIVGAISPDIRNSKVKINQMGNQLNRADYVPMRSIAGLSFDAGEVSLGVWPHGWLLERHDGLEIEIVWDGKEKPGEITFIYLTMNR